MISDSLRMVEILKGGEWVESHFSNVRKGNIVRLFEPTGEPVKGFGGKIKFKALTDAYIDMEHNVYIFACKEM